jgi:hypothetical protein
MLAVSMRIMIALALVALIHGSSFASQGRDPLPRRCQTDVACAASNMDLALSCEHNPRLASACFRLRGRLSQRPVGPPTRVIWRVGTDRVLGIVEKDRALPENAESALAYDDFVFGDFNVCPFTESRPGFMQFVCVQSASNLRVEKRR